METQRESVVSIRLRINGTPEELRVRPRESLAEALRSKGLTGTHLSCQIGVCGTCSIVMDGALTRGCLVLAVQADGHNVMTVEGLSRNGSLTDVQRAMREQHAVQCGFCTPGFVVLLTWLQDNAQELDDRELGEAISSNLCRCTGYAGLIRAAEQVLGRRIDLRRSSDPSAAE